MIHKVQLPQAGRTISVPQGRTILDTALNDRVDYPHGCKSGRCGSCKSRLIGGVVDLLPHTPFALSAEERSEGLILACRALPRSDVTVAWLGGEDEIAGLPVRSISGRVEAVSDATHDIKRIWIRFPSSEPFEFKAGQYARLSFPGAPRRDYSMASRPDEELLEFHIRRVPGGSASERIAATAGLGVTVTVEGPFGSAFLRERHGGPIVAVAGGSGLAPIGSIVQTALAKGMGQPIHLYFGVRSERDLYLTELFAALAGQHRNFRFVPVLSEAPQNELRSGFVSDAVGADLPDLDGWKAYFAGPPAMVDAAAPLLLERGIRKDDIHADVFFTPERQAA